MAAARPIPEKVAKIYRMPKPDIFSRGVRARLPEAYKKFYEEWRAPSKIAIHYRPEEGKWKRDPLTGEVSPVQNVPIQVIYPLECQKGIWGGEGVLLGYKKQRKYIQKTTRWFVPTLLRSVVYSEILDKRLSTIVTKRTVALIADHKGFDNYILETPDSELKSLLALKLKKKMLITLFDKTLYPDEPAKQEKIYNKYKHHLDEYNREDLEWYALNINEAVNKLLHQEDSLEPKPLKHQFRAELIEELKTLAENEELDKVLKEEGRSKSWLSRINPFSKTG